MKALNLECCVIGMVSTNCYIVYRKERDENSEEGGLKPGVIIDPGDNAPYILNKCRELNVEPKAILLTHGHFDHILAAEDIRRTFHIPILASEREMELLEEPDMNLSSTYEESMSLTADRRGDIGTAGQKVERHPHAGPHGRMPVLLYRRREPAVFRGYPVFGVCGQDRPSHGQTRGDY